MPSSRRLWFAGEVDSFAELDALIERYNVKATVVDGLPGGHAAREFAERHLRRVRFAQYRPRPGHEYESGRPRRVLINRTEAFDEVFEKVRTGQSALPGGGAPPGRTRARRRRGILQGVDGAEADA